MLARLLSPEDFGMINIGLSILILAGTLSYLGYAQGISRFTAYYAGSNQNEKIKPGLVSINLVTIFLSLICSFSVYYFSNIIAVRCFHDIKLEPILKIFSIGILFFSIAQVLNGSLRGLKKIHLLIITDNILWRVLPLIVFLLLFFLFGLRLEGAAWAYVSGTITMSIVAGYFVFRETASLPGRMIFSKTCFKEITKFSLPLSLANIMNQLRGKMDIFLIGFFLSSGKVGIFTVALTLASMLNIFLSSVVMIFNPVASELYGKGDIDNLSKIFSMSLKWLFILVFPVMLFLVFFSESSITIIFGQNYKGAAPLLAILAICYFLKSAVGPTGATLLATGRSNTVFVINMISLGISLLLCLTLIPVFGLIGGAFATGIAVVFQQAAMLFLLKNIIDLKFWGMRILIYVAYCLVLVYLTSFNLGDYITNIYSLFSVALVYYALSLAGAIVTGQVTIGQVQNLLHKRLQ